MMKGFTDKGEIKDVKVTDDGELKVQVQESKEAQEMVVVNDSTNAVPVKVKNTAEFDPIPVDIAYSSAITPLKIETVNEETTLLSEFYTVPFFDINMYGNKVTNLDIANLTTSHISITITTANGQKTYSIASNMSVTLPINEIVNRIQCSGSANGTVQIIVKGVEVNGN